MHAPANQAKDIFAEREWTTLGGGLGLSRRQTQIVRCVIRGNSDKQIARRFRMSASTVRTHLTRAFDKLNVRNRNELILFILRQFRKGCYGPACRRRRR